MPKEKGKSGRNPKLNPKTHCIMVHFDDSEWNDFLSMFEESGRSEVQGAESGQDDAGLLHQAVGLPRSVPLHRHELQSGRQGAAHLLLGEEGDGVALQAGEVHH